MIMGGADGCSYTALPSLQCRRPGLIDEELQRSLSKDAAPIERVFVEEPFLVEDEGL